MLFITSPITKACCSSSESIAISITKTHTVTLVKGHGWAFNGRSAWKSIAERWRDETSQWAGSNYLCYNCGIIFDNDPFEYKHHEEQYITNPKDVILFNYGASMPRHNKPSLVLSSSSHLLPASRGRKK